MPRLILISMILALLVAGCREKPADRGADRPQGAVVAVTGTPTEQVQRTVQRYNQLLAEGYRTLNMNPLQEVATPAQAEKAYVHMAAIGEGQARMDSQLKKLTFVRTTFPQRDRCQVATDEVWDFAYLNIKTGVKEGEQKGFLYHVTYALELKEGRWIITDIVANSDEPVPASSAPPPSAPSPSGRGPG